MGSDPRGFALTPSPQNATHGIFANPRPFALLTLESSITTVFEQFRK